MSQIQSFNPVVSIAKAQPRKPVADTVLQQIFSGNPAAPQKTMPNASASLLQVYFGALSKSQQALRDRAESVAATSIDTEQFRQELKVIPFSEFLSEVVEQPQIVANSYQRLRDMIEAQGFEDTGKRDAKGDRIMSPKFFSNPENGENAIVGMDVPLNKLYKSLKAASEGHDVKSRFFMFEGPVGTAKSTIMTLLKRGQEEWTKTEQGKMYSLYWDNIPEEVANDPDLKLDTHPKTGTYFYEEPMHDDPLRVIPETDIRDGKTVRPRQQLLNIVNESFRENNGGHAPYPLGLEGGLSPASDLIRKKLLEYYSAPENKHLIPDGETPMSVILKKHVNAKRMIMDETKRIGIATYMPKDPKNQDSTELNGDIDYSKLPMYGDPNHPLVQAYKGEFNVANRGIMEFVEILKLQREFLYDLLTASQERRIKPKNGTMIPIDMVIFGHTNMEELDEKKKDGKMKAFFNRAVRIRVPYLLNPDTEKKIYEKGFVKRMAEKGVTLAPHALDVAARWAVNCRLNPAINAGAQQAASQQQGVNQVYGLYGTSPRFLQGVFSYAAVHSQVEETGTVTPFVILRTIQEQLEEGGILDDKNLPHYMNELTKVKAELAAMLQKDVFEALKDSALMQKYHDRYLDNLEKWSNPETRSQAVEAFMDRIEQKMKAPVADDQKAAYRNDIMLRYGALEEGPIVNRREILEQDDKMREAIAAVLFEDMSPAVQALSPTEVAQAMVETLKDENGKPRYNEASALEAIQHLTTKGGIL